MPLINLCVAGATDDEEALSWGRKATKKKKKKEKARTVPPVDDFHIRTIVHRRLGDEVDPEIMTIINDPNRDILLLFPSDDAVSLDEGMNEIGRRRKEREEKSVNTINHEKTSGGPSSLSLGLLVSMFGLQIYKLLQHKIVLKGNLSLHFHGIAKDRMVS